MQSLADFLVSWRMLLGLNSKSNVSEEVGSDLKHNSLKSCLFLVLGEKSGTQKIMIAPERSRNNLKNIPKCSAATVKKNLEEVD